MKTEFDLKYGSGTCTARIFEQNDYNPKAFIKVYTPLKQDLILQGKDLELFAVNILKALKSKKLKQ